jgi:hypothetical protein
MQSKTETLVVLGSIISLGCAVFAVIMALASLDAPETPLDFKVIAQYENCDIVQMNKNGRYHYVSICK